MVVRTSQDTLRNLCFKAFVRHGRHLGDVDEFVAGMVEIKTDGVFLGDDEIAICTLAPRQLGVEEAGATGCEVFFQMMYLAIVRCLCFIELGGVVGATNFAGSHFVKRPT